MERPAYVTRCPKCWARVEIKDEWVESKVNGKSVYWFDPDVVLSKHC